MAGDDRHDDMAGDDRHDDMVGDDMAGDDMDTPGQPVQPDGARSGPSRAVLAAVVAVVAALVVAVAVLVIGGDEAAETVAPETTLETTTTTVEEVTTTVAETTTTTEAEAEVDGPVYAGPGPFAAGVTGLDLDGRFVEVWYPADPEEVAGVAPAVFEIRDLVPAELGALVPDELNPAYPTAGLPDVPASGDGPFPVVGLSHGFAAYPTLYQFLATHLASWGMVVVGPVHTERDLFAAATGQVTEGDDGAVLLAALDAVVAAGDGPLAGLVYTGRMATIGHSAGVRAATDAAASDPRIGAVIAMAGGSAETTVPGVPVLVLAGGRDAVIEVGRITGFADSLGADGLLAVIEDAGHNAFTDLCLIGEDQGGLLAIIEQLGLPVDDRLLALLADGCTEAFLPAEEAWPVIRHLAVAHLRSSWGENPRPVGLDQASVDQFDVTVTLRPVG
jgi:dienelactone hydrolase